MQRSSLPAEGMVKSQGVFGFSKTCFFVSSLFVKQPKRIKGLLTVTISINFLQARGAQCRP